MPKVTIPISRVILRHGFLLLPLFFAGCGDEPTSALTQASTTSRDGLFTAKQRSRAEILKRSATLSSMGPEAGYDHADDPSELVDLGDALLRNIRVIEGERLMAGRLVEKPWSDSYWPTYAGGISNRYSDDDFPDSPKWDENFAYVAEHPALDAWDSQDAARIDELAPAEKYDLVSNNRDLSLTQRIWSEGKQYFDRLGEVPTWFGICHGWAAASFMVPRPTRTVTIPALNGRPSLTFYPSDIKALTSLLWANGNFGVRHLGGRCNDPTPARDENGRIISTQCFDINPGAWHLAVVNQIGKARRGLIMDASFDEQVWNQPIYGYKYSYFQPETGEETSSLNQAKIPLEAHTKDKFKTYRNAQTTSIVGVIMEVTYISETTPTQTLENGPDRDAERTVRYQYDLELDADENVIGGEWHQANHPDFLWTPLPGTHALSSNEPTYPSEWNVSKPVPKEWERATRKAAEMGQPVAKIVNALLQASDRR